MTHRRRNIERTRYAQSLSVRALLCGCVLFASLPLIGCQALKNEQAKHENLYGRLSRHAIEGTMGPVEGQDELDKAKAVFDEKKYALAEPMFRKIAKKYKDKPIEEDAMFYIAECQYNLEQYPRAQDSYDELLNKYTSTRYIDQIPRRLFHIAKTWLNSPQPAKEVEQVEFVQDAEDKPVQKEPLKPYLATLAPNVTDKTRPLFDPEGRALQALKSIWLKDPTGPLADDALMMSATHHMRRRDFKEADDLFNIIRSEYPQSEHAQTAYLLGSHVKLLTYQGSAYDGKQLEEAQKLTESTLRLFSDLDEKEKLQTKLYQMTEARAARDWENVQFYLRKGQKTSAAFYCEVVLREHPNSSYAAKAMVLLKRLKPPPKSSGKDLTPLDPGEDESYSEQPQSDELPSEPEVSATRPEPAKPAAPPKRIRVQDVEDLDNVPAEGSASDSSASDGPASEENAEELFE